MPIDPNIALGGKAPTAINPLELAGGFAEVQNKLNTAKQFKAEFAAKQRFGEIMANSPDMDTAIVTAFQDPQTSAFAPQLAASAANTRNTMVNSAGQVQEQSKSAYEQFVKSSTALLQTPDEGTWDSIKGSSLALASPFAKERLGKSIDYFKQGLTHDLSDDPETRQKQLTQRLSGFAIASGAGDAVPRILGAPGLTNTGDALQPTVTAPAQGGPNGQAPGSLTKSGNALQLGLSPGMYNAEGNLAGGKYGAGGSVASPGKSESAALDPAMTGKVGADNKPLVPDGMTMESPPVDRSSFGVPIGTQAPGIAKMHEKWAGAETEAYQTSGVLLGQLAEMKHNLTSLESGKGFMSPGSGAEFRLGVAKLGKLVEDVTGADLGVDKSKIANAEDAMKLTQRLGISYLTSALGSQREAAETIRNITEKGIPGIQNTYLGSALMTDMITAVAKRSMEEHEFRTLWQSKNRGNLTGADIAFNKAHPASSYIDQALDTYGLSKDGFTSRAAMDSALQRGLITPAQAEAIRNNKGKIPDDLPKAETDNK